MSFALEFQVIWRLATEVFQTTVGEKSDVLDRV